MVHAYSDVVIVILVVVPMPFWEKGVTGIKKKSKHFLNPVIPSIILAKPLAVVDIT